MIMNRNRSIVWIHSHFLYWMGGTKYIFEVTSRLAKTHKLKVIVENANNRAVETYKRAGVKLINLSKPTSTSLLYWLTFPFQIFDTYLRVRKYVDRDSVVITSMFPMNVVARMLKIKHYQLCFEPFAFFHDPDYIQEFPAIKRIFIKLLKFLYSRLDISSTRTAKEIITLNQVTAKGIKAIYKRSSTPVYTGIDTYHFKPYVSKTIENKYKGKVLIIHSTDYTPVKGTDKMLKIFREVHKQVPNSILAITSTIPSSPALRSLTQQAKALGLSDHVDFLGFVDYDVLPQLYSLARVLVQCSYSELSGTTSMALPVKEAMACGTLCIRAPVTLEDVEDGVTGYLVDPRDEKKMIEKIIEVISMPTSVYKKASKIARRKILSRYSWVNTVGMISRIING